MVNNGKGMLTRLSKDKTFSDVLLHLLFIKETLTLEEAEYLFSVAIVFIEEFEREKKDIILNLPMQLSFVLV